MSRLRHLLPAAALLSLFGVLSRVLGVVRDRLLTSQFGRALETDAFLAANRLPDLLYQLLIVGAVSSVFIPTYAQVRRRSEDDARQFATNVLLLVCAALGVASLLAAVFATPIARLLTAGFDERGIALTVELMRVQLLAPIMLGASSICASLLQTRGTFWTFAVAPLLYNAGQILGITVLAQRWGVAGASWGVVIGAALHLGLQLPAYLATRPALLPRRALHDPLLRRMLHQAAPRMLALTGSQVNLVVETSLASLLAAGSITALTYGQNLMSFPLGVIGLPIAIAAFPTMSEHAAREDHGAFRAHLLKALRQTLFWILPASVGLLLLRSEILTALFLSAKFTAADVAATAGTLAVFSLALVTQALIPLCARAFYAQHDTRRPVVAALVSIAVNVALSSLFVLGLGWDVRSLALAYTVASTVNFALHAWSLGRYAGPNWGSALQAPLARMLLASGIMGALVWGVRELLASNAPFTPWWGSVLRLAVGSATGFAAYLAVMVWLGGGEWREALRLSHRGAPATQPLTPRGRRTDTTERVNPLSEEG